jgi:hypothetical protein
LKFTGLVIGLGLWETVGMANYNPKVDDPVFMDGKAFIRYVVTKVDAEKKTADVKTTAGTIVLHRDVPWGKLFELDESQNAVRIVREATGNS